MPSSDGPVPPFEQVSEQDGTLMDTALRCLSKRELTGADVQFHHSIDFERDGYVTPAYFGEAPDSHAAEGICVLDWRRVPLFWAPNLSPTLHKSVRLFVGFSKVLAACIAGETAGGLIYF